MLRKYLERKQKTIIFVSHEHQTFVERSLLEIQPAFYHIQVTTIERYVLDLLKKNHLFDYQLISKKTSLYALKASLEIEGLHYFKNLQLTEGLVKALLEAYEIMSDLDFEKIQNTGKWYDLKRMYQKFLEVKGNEYFLNELLYLVLPYIEKDVCYVDLSFSSYTNAVDTFFKKCQVERIEFKDRNGIQSFYKVQFPHQEIDLVISKISEWLKQGKKYSDFIVYVPSSDWINKFVEACPYPCHHKVTSVNNYDLAFMDALYNLTLDEGLLEELKYANNSERKAILEKKVSIEIPELEDELDFDTYCLFVKILCGSQALEGDNTYDCINVVTYQTPIVCHSFEEVFLLGLNEDVYPSKVSEAALILNDELLPFYKNGTPILQNSKIEVERLEAILSTSKLALLSCHYSALDGSEVLPSLLYKQLLGNQKELTYHTIFPTKVDEISSAFDGVVQPLRKPKELYKKDGISASELETYNACPYKHFLNYGLRIRPKKGKLETRAKFGTLMHDMLDKSAPLFSGDFNDALKHLENHYHLDSLLPLDERLKALLDAYLAEYTIELNDNEELYLYKQFPIQFLNTLKILLFHIESGQFKMTFHEESFNYNHEGVKFAGRIDRGDVYKNYLKIIDYKSSNKTLDLALALEGFNIQMALYLEMLSKSKNLEKGALLYFNTRQRKLEANGNMYVDKTSVEDFESAYKQEGWILKEGNHDVMFGIDHNYPESRIAHIKYVKSKDDYTGRLLEKETLDIFISLIFKHLHKLVDECFEKGNIAITPAGSEELSTQMKVSPCQYCDYQDVCMRDPFYHEERKIKVLKNDELDMILEGGEKNG